MLNLFTYNLLFVVFCCLLCFQYYKHTNQGKGFEISIKYQELGISTIRIMTIKQRILEYMKDGGRRGGREVKRSLDLSNAKTAIHEMAMLYKEGKLLRVERGIYQINPKWL